jgi:predicted dehydrogenase
MKANMNVTPIITRRQFLRDGAFAAAAVGLAARSWAGVAGANDDIRIAVVGFNGQGRGDLEGLRKVSGVRVVALCDVDRHVLEAEAKKFRDRGESIHTCTDVRQLLENKDVDAISTATPNHWHALISIWACQAGKDVYVQKPVSHNVWEGRKLVEAARKYRRIVQTGTQSRSSHAIREAVAWVRAGNLGRIQLARGLCYKPRRSIGKVSGPQRVPDWIDYDLWCGPAPKGPLMRAKLHYDWHWVFDTGNGDLGNQGIHQVDIARWFLGEGELAPRVFSVGGRVGYEDDGNTPNTQIVFQGYRKAPLLFEVRGLPRDAASQQGDLWGKSMDNYQGAQIGVVIHCEGGRVVVPNYSSATAFDKAGKEIRKFEGATSHYENFIKAVRSRRHTDLNADILEGHLSSALCHTGNISYSLGRKASQDEIREILAADADAAEAFDRMAEHVRANGVDLGQTPLTMGASLRMNPRTERFKQSKAANALLTREYRAPFVVPERV